MVVFQAHTATNGKEVTVTKGDTVGLVREPYDVVNSAFCKVRKCFIRLKNFSL